MNIIVVVALVNKAALFAVGIVLLLLPALGLKFFAKRDSAQSPLAAAQSYLKAMHARDYRDAYRFISSADRIILDQESYLEAQPARRGFAVQLAKQLAAQMEIRLVEGESQGDRARLTLDYKVPAADELSSLLHHWDEEKLNALPQAEQRRMLELLEKLKYSRNLITTGGRETFTLIKEAGHWKILLNWASAIKVSFAAAAPRGAAIEVEVLRRTLFATTDEPFQASLRLRNPGERALVVAIDHRIEPREFSGRLAMIACGFLRPLTLNPSEEREVSSAYLLDSGFPKNTPLRITFELNLAGAPSAAGWGKDPHGAGL